MKLIDKIYKTITFLCALVLFGACDNDKWAEVELDSTPVYELTYLKNVETGKTGEDQPHIRAHQSVNIRRNLHQRENRIKAHI